VLNLVLGRLNERPAFTTLRAGSADSQRSNKHILEVLVSVNDLVIDLLKASGVAVRVPAKFSAAQLLADLESTKYGRAVNR
jgi:hypothetical protein